MKYYYPRLSSYNTTQSPILVDIHHHVNESILEPAFLIDCFEATVSLQGSNLNLSRSRLTPLALFILLPVLLSSKELYPTLKHVLSSRQSLQSSIVCFIFKHLMPLHRSEGVYTVGLDLDLEETKRHLQHLASALRSTEVPSFGLLSKDQSFNNFVDCVASDLEMLSACVDREDFVTVSLDMLATLPQLLSVGTKSWEQLSPVVLGTAPDNAVLGIRRLFWVGDTYLGCNGETPNPTTIYLFRLLVSRSFVTIGDSRREMSVLNPGVSVIGFIYERQTSIIKFILNSVALNGGSLLDASADATPPTRPPRGRQNPQPDSPPGGRSYSTTAFVDNLPTFGTIIKGKIISFKTYEEMVSFTSENKIVNSS
jgi:hypothetical protein